MLSIKTSRPEGIVYVRFGQKPTCAPQKGTSALPPIATAKADFRTRSCLLYPRKWTCAVQKGMSALPLKATLNAFIRSPPRAAPIYRIDLRVLRRCRIKTALKFSDKGIELRVR
jgi:hypothetical protein